ncbi:uncharacterized protein Z519_01246 [Cladophialophora bantiana CBS 173.52]|uniref:DUF7924 domain-containing protein n=1 Tax=Cladophialophora bantiana (strain ATCC 10958 / CBS 173.52 / CDC B-1940 / NIH 8579) TaxID=1442370 RepID=A0A0D2GH27_CLAB1|nr:uncharacterized protein Z519_01246 [Cladophialophora bantiana CBS 173.52]KIW97662.1 hypothetical protein Z519_01246 [Cladophialophora bantiana CBS 173.52]
MLSSNTKNKQRMKVSPSHHNHPGGSTSGQRPHTRSFARLHGLSVKDFTLEDLDVASGKTRSRRVSQPLPLSTSVSSSPLLPSKVRQARKTAVEPGGTLSTLQTRSNKNKERPLLERLDGTDARNLRSQQPQSPTACRGAKVQPQPRELPIGSSPPRPGFEHATTTEKRDTVSVWLDLISPSTAQTSHDFTQRRSYSHIASASDPADMESSSSAQTNTSATTDDATTTKASTVRHIPFMEHLEFRGITDEPSSDEKLQELDLDKIIHATPSHVEFQKFESLLRVLEDYLKKLRKSVKDQSSDNGLPVYDALRHDINHWRPETGSYRRFPPMSPQDFAWDRMQCSTSSEADFHRTVMISIIDRLDFRSVFAFSCEEQWRIEKQFLIKPRKPSSKITQPKPDLAISFHRGAFIEARRLEYPLELGNCLHPGKRGRERWFPFLFMEAKREDSSLRTAFEKNLYSASQALFNIFQWMRLIPQLHQKFFKDVRTFSIVLNNEDMVLRMHRAERDGDSQLRYEFTEVAKIRDYSRDAACHLVKSILLDYGLSHLHPILKDTFRMVVEMDHLRESGAKRKQDLMDAQTITEVINNGPGPEETDTPRLQSTNTGLSFDADNLTLTARENAPKRSRKSRGGR